MNEPMLDNLHQRVECLERENRRPKLAGLVVLAVVGGLLFMGAVKPPKVVQAERFVVRDSAGKVRATLAAPDTTAAIWLNVSDPGQPAALVLYDEKSTPRAMIAATSTQSVLLMHDASKNFTHSQVNLWASKYGPSLTLLDADGKQLFHAP